MIVIELPPFVPFEDYFGYFIRYGFGHKTIPAELRIKGQKFFNRYLSQHESKLKLRWNGLTPDDFIEELIRLTFTFQFFAETRMKTKPKFDNLGIISEFQSFAEIKNKLQVDEVTLSKEEYEKHKDELEKLRIIRPILSKISKDFNTKKSLIKKVQIEIIMNPGIEAKERKIEKIMLPSIMWSDLIKSIAHSSLNSLAKLDSFKNISNREKKGDAIIIQMLRGAMISYVRDRVLSEEPDRPLTDISNEEAYLIGLVLSGAGFLKNEAKYKDDPDYDDLSYYQYLYTKAKEAKLLRKGTPSATFNEDEEMLYSGIPLMFDKL